MNYSKCKITRIVHTKGTIKENLDSINETNGRNNDPDQRLKDFSEIRAFNSASVIYKSKIGYIM